MKDKKDVTAEHSAQEKDKSEVIKELKTVLDTKAKKVSIQEEPLVLPAPVAPAYANARLSIGPLTPRKLTDETKDTVNQIRPS